MSSSGQSVENVKAKDVPLLVLISAYLIVMTTSVGIASLIGTLFTYGIVLVTLKIVGTVCAVSLVGLLINGVVASAIAPK